MYLNLRATEDYWGSRGGTDAQMSLWKKKGGRLSWSTETPHPNCIVKKNEISIRPCHETSQ